MILHDSETFPEPLKMHDFPGTKEFDGVINIRIVFDETENVVISDSGFLFWQYFFRTYAEVEKEERQE